MVSRAIVDQSVNIGWSNIMLPNNSKIFPPPALNYDQSYPWELI